jgi:aminopeptidase N
LKYVFPNYEDYGYGIFLLDDKSRDYVLKNIQNEKDDFLRTMMWGNLWDSVREGELDPKIYVELVIKNLQASQSMRAPASVRPPPSGKPPIYPETDESTIATLLGRVGTAMNYYIGDEQRREIAPRLEEELRDIVLSSFMPEREQLTVFRYWLNLASTERSRLNLKSILQVSMIKAGISKQKLPDSPSESPSQNQLIEIPPLRTKDRFDIVSKLLILGDPDAEGLLAELEKAETSDEAKRYAYAARAGIGSAGNKAKFWNDYTANKDVSESWIESSLPAFNAPRQAELTLPYLEPALAELPRLKRDRKIFFVNSWLAAFISGQKSEQSLAIVNKFLADNPNLDNDLRLKILENVDLIERAVKIRARYAK